VSFSVDVNVLLYASDAGSQYQAPARRFLETCAGGDELFCLAWPTVMSYLRIATHSAIFGAPLEPAEARSNVEALLALPHVRVLGEEEGFWGVYQKVTGALPVRGKLVPDAHLAALLRQHGVSRLYTHDRDFLKFDFLDVRDPFV
jgi:toxin-antitoxin system PIN domain toxin